MRPTRHEARLALARKAREAGQNAVVGQIAGPDGRDGIDAGEKYVLVEWIGERSFTQNPTVAYKLLREGKPDGFTEHQARVIRIASDMRIGRFKGHNRAMGPESGLSRTYLWGPKAKTYVRRVLLADAEKIKASASGHEFKIADEDPQGQLVLPDNFVRLTSAREFSRIETVAGLGG